MFKKFVQNPYSLLLLAVYVAALYVLLNKAIVPFVTKVVTSEDFAGDPSQSGQPTEIHDNRTAMALLQCNRFVKDEFDEEVGLTFENKAYHSWDIGYGRFIINSHVNVAAPNEPMVRKNYVCEIKFAGGDLENQDSWDLKGLAMHDVKMAATLP